MPQPKTGGEVNGFWGNADWLRCRDGFWRSVEPGTFPLVDGIAPKVGQLRAYGNAVNAQAAQVFIESVMECIPEYQTVERSNIMSTQPFAWKPETIIKADFKKQVDPTAYAGQAVALNTPAGPLIVLAPNTEMLAHIFHNEGWGTIDLDGVHEASLVCTAHLVFAPEPMEHDTVILSAEVFEQTPQPLDDEEL